MTFDSRKVAIVSEDRHRGSPRQSVARKRGAASWRRDAAHPSGSDIFFERGPSVDMVLQWATYRDAADQCSLSRIWGGIHPPADDIPGRLIGARIGRDAFAHAKSWFEGRCPRTDRRCDDVNNSADDPVYFNLHEAKDRICMTMRRNNKGNSWLDPNSSFGVHFYRQNRDN